METTVKITWDEPQDENWLCPENIKLALLSYCTNTKFEVEKVIPLELPVKPASEFIPIVAHVIVKNREAINNLENLCAGNGNEFYIDFVQSLTSYKAK